MITIRIGDGLARSMPVGVASKNCASFDVYYLSDNHSHWGLYPPKPSTIFSKTFDVLSLIFPKYHIIYAQFDVLLLILGVHHGYT